MPMTERVLQFVFE